MLGAEKVMVKRRSACLPPLRHHSFFPLSPLASDCHHHSEFPPNLNPTDAVAGLSGNSPTTPEEIGLIGREKECPTAV